MAASGIRNSSFHHNTDEIYFIKILCQVSLFFYEYYQQLSFRILVISCTIKITPLARKIVRLDL